MSSKSASSKKSYRPSESSRKVKKALEKHRIKKIKRKNKKIVLEYEKFIEYVEKRHHYYVISVIVDAKTELVKFIECRTPIRQKTFFVYINPKYVMKAPEEKNIRMRVTYLKDESPTPRNKEFIESIRGRTVRCDMLIIASDMVYFVTETSESQPPDIRCFSVGDDDEEEVEEVKPNKFKKITDSIKKIADSLGVDRPSNKPKKQIETLESEEDEEEDIDIVEDDGEPYDPVKSTMKATVGEVIVSKDPSGKIIETMVEPSKLPDIHSELPKKPKTVKKNLTEEEDIVDEDEDLLSDDIELVENVKEDKPQTNPVETVSTPTPQPQATPVPQVTPNPPAVQEPYQSNPEIALSTVPVAAPAVQAVVTAPVSSITPVVQPAKKNFDSDDSESLSSEDEDESDIDEDNEMPDIEEEGIVLGMAYIVVDIHMFFLKIENYENELADYYVEIEENEQSVRKGRVERITYLAENIRTKVTEWFDRQTEKEASIKVDISSLSVAILQITSIKRRIEQNPTKYRSDIIQEITKLDELYASSREMVREQTVKLLKIRDIIENVLYECTEVLEKASSSFHEYLSDEE